MVVISMDQKRTVRNQLFDLAYRYWQAAGTSWLSTIKPNLPPPLSRAWVLLDKSSILSTTLSEEVLNQVFGSDRNYRSVTRIGFTFFNHYWSTPCSPISFVT